MEDFSSNSPRSITVLCKDLFRNASALGVLNLDFSRKGLKEFPENPPICPKLECLYLEGNQLTAIPRSLSILYPSLCWLDLRYNAITSLPSTVCKLRNLKTLLLEGNELLSLPPQLGLLQRLDGLSLSGNPLQSPPPDIVEKGTKAVLHFLRGLLQLEGDSDAEGTSSEQDDGEAESAPPSRQSIVRRSIDYGSRSKGLFLKPATLHCSLDQQKRKQEHITNLLLSMEKLKKSNRVRTRKGSHKKTLPVFKQPAKKKQKDNEKITEELERKKSQQCLSDWREETKRRQQRQQQDGNLTAPYATDEGSVKKAIRLPSAMHEEKSNNDNAADTTSGVGTITEWTKEYVRQHLLPDTCTTEESTEHEKASQLNKTKTTIESADHKKREYRLRAFTGDTVFF